ncbi:hypothetical protein BOTCAL_0031g00110 [Botryotinia calthae]|uniref:Uncharacterized protein n=1 Tax=Botryotinia calthae TaxID=38488 RepID=A0A4Y8DFJ7_9HELO|nr:hypothetical protein BOTCAL_0031g00110 [Botryotinia calthae]
MTRYGFIRHQHVRKEARALPHSYSPNEVPSPWWAPLVMLKRLKLKWFHRFRPRRSNSVSSNEPNVPSEYIGADESGGQEKVIEGDQNSQSTISSSQSRDLASNYDNNTLNRSTSIVSPTSDDLFKIENTTNVGGILAGDNTEKSKNDPGVRQSLNKTTDPEKHANPAIRGEGNVTNKISGANENRFTSISLRFRTVRGSKFRDEEFTAERPTKNWVSRFKDSQKGISPHRRQKNKTKSKKDNARKRVWRKLQFRDLGMELSYAEVKKAERKPRNHLAVDSRIGNTREPRPGYSNLRYCLTYLKQAQDTVSDFRNLWARDHKQWSSRWSTVRAAALCLGV